MAETEILCTTCRSPKAGLDCELCGEPVCKSCIQYLDADRFSFHPNPAAELLFSRYCQSCYDANVGPAIETYDAKIEEARQVTFLGKTYRGYIPVKKKALERVQ